MKYAPYKRCYILKYNIDICLYSVRGGFEMSKMKIYEPAMCCSTGLCGVGVDQELLRMSIVLNNLSKLGIVVERYNLSNAPQEFINNKAVNEFINSKGVDELPVIVVDDKIVITGRYPNNDEISKFLNVAIEKFSNKPTNDNNQGGCCCPGGCC